jgi:hypothetical protein
MIRNLIKRQMPFAKAWCSILWRAMTSTGKGYRLHSMKHTGVAGDRRADKLSDPMPTQLRRYRSRYGP